MRYNNFAQIIMLCQCKKSYNQCYGPEDADSGMTFYSKEQLVPSNLFLCQVKIARAIVFFISYMVIGFMKNPIIISSVHTIVHYWSAGVYWILGHHRPMMVYL